MHKMHSEEPLAVVLLSFLRILRN